MAQIFRCDFCSKITDDIVAEIRIMLKQSPEQVFGKRPTVGANPNINSGYSSQMDGFAKDACGDCVREFIKTKKEITTVDFQKANDLTNNSE